MSCIPDIVLLYAIIVMIFSVLNFQKLKFMTFQVNYWLFNGWLATQLSSMYICKLISVIIGK